MTTADRGPNPLAALVHLVAIAAGLWLGWAAMGAITPDLPGDDVDPGVISSAAPEAVEGRDPDSLLLPGNLTLALAQLKEQIPAGQGVIRLRIEPGSISVKSGEADGAFELDEVKFTTPERIAEAISAERPKVTLDDVASMELVATGSGPRWHVQLASGETDVSPPWTYTAPLEGGPVRPGGREPIAIDE